MEEVKEKPLSQKRAEAIERGKQHSTEYYSALSILEKLREWVDKELKLQGYEHQQILDKIDLLTSLETKEESVVNYCDSRTDEERARDAELYRTAVTTCTSNVWTPKP